MPRLDLHDPKCELRVRPMYGLPCNCSLVDRERRAADARDKAKAKRVARQHGRTSEEFKGE